MSVVWRFYSKCPDDLSKARCSICIKKVSRGGSNSCEFSSTDLMNHLKRSHHNELMKNNSIKKKNCSKIYIFVFNSFYI